MPSPLPESVANDRRKFLKSATLAGLGVALGGCLGKESGEEKPTKLTEPNMVETHHRLKSLHLANERSVWLLAPKHGVTPSRLAVFLDAERYRKSVDVIPLLTEGADSGAFSDTLFVFVSEQSPEARWRECPCHAPFARFINEDLPAFLESVHPGIGNASERLIIGLSYTGLAAAFVAFSSPKS